MLPSHDRYDYSCIDTRKKYTWPGGKTLAFYIALNIEHFAFLTGRGMDPTHRGGPLYGLGFYFIPSAQD